jgi:hypothetical protein
MELLGNVWLAFFFLAVAIEESAAGQWWTEERGWTPKVDE